MESKFPNTKLHFTSRGKGKESFFYDDEDFLESLFILKEMQCTYPFILPTYCPHPHFNHSNDIVNAPFSASTFPKTVTNYVG